MAEGQSLERIHWVAEFLITVLKNLCPFEIVEHKRSGSVSSPKH